MWFAPLLIKQYATSVVADVPPTAIRAAIDIKGDRFESTRAPHPRKDIPGILLRVLALGAALTSLG